MVWIEIVKEIYGMKVGHIQEWCDRKAAVVLASGHGKKVSKPKDEKPAKVEKVVEVVETASLKPKAETADNPPVMEKKDEKPFFARKPKKD